MIRFPRTRDTMSGPWNYPFRLHNPRSLPWCAFGCIVSIVLVLGGCDPWVVAPWTPQGATMVETIVPNGPGHQTDLTPVGAATTWEAAASLSRSSYCKLFQTWVPPIPKAPPRDPELGSDFFTFDVSSITGFIRKVTVLFDVRLYENQPTATSSITPYIYDGTEYILDSRTSPFDGTWALEYTQDPITKKTWLKEELDTYEFGYYATASAVTGVDDVAEVDVYYMALLIETENTGQVTRSIIYPRADVQKGWRPNIVGDKVDTTRHWVLVSDGDRDTRLQAPQTPATESFLLEHVPISKTVGSFRVVVDASVGTSMTLTPFYYLDGVRYDGTNIVVTSGQNIYSFQWELQDNGDAFRGKDFHQMEAGFDSNTSDVFALIHEMYWEIDHIQTPARSFLIMQDDPDF